FFSIPRFKTVALRCECASASEMQAFRRLFFHRCPKRVTHDVVCQQRTIKKGHAYSGCDQKKIVTAPRKNEPFPSQGCKVTKLHRYKVITKIPCNFFNFCESLRLARHSQLRKKKCVSVGQLFDALVQRSANAVTCTGARPQ